jgi:NAD(P)-dependent dehydrogenase (short-subunit alcohol dehydrogenase family)
MRRVLRFVKRTLGRILVAQPSVVPVKVPVLQSDLLKGRTALITGSTKGIGFAIAEAFAEAGATVLISGRNRQTIDVAVKKLSKKGRSICGIEMDMTDIATMEKVVANLPTIDILVNNAGFVGGEGFGKTSEQDYNLILDTNLKGAYFLSQSVSRMWIKDGVRGNILNVCSASSLRPGNSPYILSKWGMRSLTVGMAKQLIRYGIVVNGIAPGVTDTDKFTHGSENIAKVTNPSGRMVTREEIANMSVVLVSSLCRMVVGDVLYMTGGGGIVTLDD